MKPIILFAALAALLIFLTPALHAQTQLVNDQGSVPDGQVCTMNPVVTNNGNSGTGTLRQAVIDACAGSTITFSATGTILLSGGQITIDKNLTIQGPGANLLTVQNTAARSPTSRVFLVNSGVTATIAGLTITGGNLYLANVGDNGGGIYNEGSLTITDSIVKNNQADSPGEVAGFPYPFGGGHR